MGILEWLFGTGESDEEKLANLQRQMAQQQKEIDELQEYIDASQTEKDSINKEVRRLQSAQSKKKNA